MSLAEWVKAGPTAARALVGLDELPRAPHGVEPPSPLAIGDKDGYHAARSAAGRLDHLAPEIASAPILAVPIGSLRTVQRSVNPERVAQYVRDPGLTPPDAVSEKHGGPVGYPIVVQVGGTRWLHDGTHRASAAALRGEPEIKARFVDLDALPRPEE